MSFVLDASVAASWGLGDEQNSFADLLRDRLAAGDEATAPSLFWYELRNTFVVAERRGRIHPQETLLFLEALAAIRITLEHRVDEALALALARRHGLSFYDAAYLACAQASALPLATLDRGLIRAAQAESVPLLG